MKRSDAINQLVHFYGSIPDGASSQHKMDMLLSRIERLGMLPPRYTKTLTDDERDMEVSNETAFLLGWKFVNEWEPETNTCKDCGIETGIGAGSARCSDCWDDRFANYDD